MINFNKTSKLITFYSRYNNLNEMKTLVNTTSNKDKQFEKADPICDEARAKFAQDLLF